MPVTIRDVAEASGVSISTVSRALKNQRGLSDDTRRMIRQVARDIGYNAARLRGAKAKQLAFMVHRQHSHFSTNPFFSDVLHGVEEACRKFGIVPTLLTCGPTDPIREQLRMHEPDMILAAGYFESEVLDMVAGLELPIALIDFSQGDLPALRALVGDDYNSWRIKSDDRDDVKGALKDLRDGTPAQAKVLRGLQRCPPAGRRGGLGDVDEFGGGEPL